MRAIMQRSSGRRSCAVLALALLAVGLTATAGPASAATPVGAVYTQTNGPANAVRVFQRASDGALTDAGSFPTGGSGSPVNPPVGFPVLDTQGSVILDRTGRLVFAVNGGSGTITSFLVKPNFTLQFAGQVSSNGVLPASVASSGSLLYVLNLGSGTISGFTVNLLTGGMTPIPGSTRSLASPGAPAQIGFDTRGRVLTVTERLTDVIETFVLGFDNRPGPATVHPSTGQTPFGFAYSRSGPLVVSNAAQDVPGASSVSSYAVGALNGSVTPVDVEATGGGAACWVVITPDTRFAFVSNATTLSISRLALGLDGSLTDLGAIPTSGIPLDMALSIDGRYVYAVVIPLPPFNSAEIQAYRVNVVNGSLSFVGTTPPGAGLPGGTSGLAAR